MSRRRVTLEARNRYWVMVDRIARCRAALNEPAKQKRPSAPMSHKMLATRYIQRILVSWSWSEDQASRLRPFSAGDSMHQIFLATCTLPRVETRSAVGPSPTSRWACLRGRTGVVEYIYINKGVKLQYLSDSTTEVAFTCRKCHSSRTDPSCCHI